MKILRYFILISLFCSGIPALAQITFYADKTSGCDSLEVIFTYLNTDFIDTVTSVEWDFGNGQTGSGKGPQTVLYDSPEAFNVGILINGNTTISRQGYIKVHATPSARFFWSDSLELGSYSVVLKNVPQAVDTVPLDYQWQFEDGGTDSVRALIHSFPEAGDYRAVLRVTHRPEGCSDQWSTIVSVRDSLDCPNVFTPNEDGINDYFIVSSNGLTVYNIQIFSRTGVMVYKAEAPIIMWDGRNLSGQELLPGTYYYVIRSANGSGRFEKSGFVELFR
ncbi:gliding motility-associated C-terminal domain-containing protein [Bacteroidota bacterium]